MNTFPQVGPPHFRYNGADPERDVVNFGFPIALAIYDQHRWILSPFWAYRLGMQGTVILILSLLPHVLPADCRRQPSRRVCQDPL